MKRTNKTEDKAVKPLWRKTTGGKLYPFSGKMNVRLGQGDTIHATAEQLGRFLDQFELVNDGTGEYKMQQPVAKVPVTPSKKETYQLKAAGKDWYNVVSSANKKMNSTKLNKEDAEKLKASLEEETSED